MFLGSCVGCLPASATSLSYWTTLSPHHYLPPTELNAMSSYGVKTPSSFHIAEILHHHQHQQQQQQQQQQHLQQQQQQQQQQHHHQHQQQHLPQNNTTNDNSSVSSNSSDFSKVANCNNSSIRTKYFNGRASSPCGHGYATVDAPVLSRSVVDVVEDGGAAATEKGGGREGRERGVEECRTVALTVSSTPSSSSSSSSSSTSTSSSSTSSSSSSSLSSSSSTSLSSSLSSSSSTTGAVGHGGGEEEGISVKREQSAMVRSVGSLLTASVADTGVISTNGSRSYSPGIDATSLTTTVTGGIAPLQALCSAGAFSRLSSSSVVNNSNGIDLSHNLSLYRGRTGPPGGATASSSSQLKFGINRILSEDFGKHRLDKENLRVTPSSRAFHVSLSTHHPHHHQHHHQQSTDTHSCHSLCACHTSAMAAAVAVGPQYSTAVYSSLHYPAHALSAVHAIQPPQYPITSSTDGLPGPYSILNTEQHSANQPKRKRSWSRAVFSNLQRKGLEKRFEVQKYVTKPDRRQLAAMLGLTDAQVKVWFQNRRMKWRHSQQQKDQKSDDRNENMAEDGKEKSDLADSSKELDNESKDSSDSSDNEEMDIENDFEDQRAIPISVTVTMPQLKCEKID